MEDLTNKMEGQPRQKDRSNYIYTIIFMSIHLPGKYTTTNVPGVSIMKLQYSDNSALNHISIRKGMLREMVDMKCRGADIID